MIEFDRVTIRYPDADAPTLREVTLRIDEGELVLVVGRTGAGKSTLLGAVNGLVPHFTGGTLAGTVRVDGRDTRVHPPRDFADLVGIVGQDPLAGFVTDTVEEELAYGMEQLAVAPQTMRRRVEETLDLLGLAGLRGRPLADLSGGQQQRVAIGAALTMHPRVLVLDEPTSSLDPSSAEDVLAAVTRLVHDLGITVLLAEHRLERVVQYADRIAYLSGDGTVISGPPATILATSAVAPPVVELGRLAGWQPLPLSVRDARRLAIRMRDLLPPPKAPPPSTRATALRARRVTVRYGPQVAVADVDVDLRRGEVAALMGRNGAGKSSLLWALQGSGPRSAGTVDVAGGDPAHVPARRARQLVGLVPQTPTDLLFLESVAAECAESDADAAHRVADPMSGTPAAPFADGLSTRILLDRLVSGIDDDRHPRDLSAGQQLALVLAIQLRAAPRVMLLDEPTRGLDYGAKRMLTAALTDLARRGHAVVVATHDVEFVASTADRVLLMADGELIADGTAAETVIGSPAFAPQVAKILSPLAYLTVDQVAAELAGAPR